MSDTETPQLDRIEIRLDSIDTNLLRNTMSLEEHIRRTNLLEEKVKPIENDRIFVRNVLKFVSITGALVLFAKQLSLF